MGLPHRISLLLLGLLGPSIGLKYDDPEYKMLFSGFELAGCLPKDFTKPDRAPCVTEDGDVGGPELYAAFACASEQHRTKTNGSKLWFARLPTVSSNDDFILRIRTDQAVCRSLINEDHLTTEEQEGVYHIECARRMWKHQCRIDMMERMGQTMTTKGAAETGKALIRLVQGNCMDSVMSSGKRTAFLDCAKKLGVNLAGLQFAQYDAAEFTQVVAEGDSKGIRPPPAEAEIEATIPQLALLEEAKKCAMEATGEIKADGSVDYPLMHKRTRDAKGRADIKKLLTNVNKRCEEQGATSGEEYLKCFHEQAPLACQVLHAEHLALFKVRSLL